MNYWNLQDLSFNFSSSLLDKDNRIYLKCYSKYLSPDLSKSYLESGVLVKDMRKEVFVPDTPFL